MRRSPASASCLDADADPFVGVRQCYAPPMRELLILLVVGGFVVCPVLAVVYALKAVGSLLGSFVCGLDVQHRHLRRSQGREHAPPAQSLPGDDGRLGTRVVEPRQAARPGIHAPLGRRRERTHRVPRRLADD